MPAISNLVDLIKGLPGTYDAEPVQLFAFSNAFSTGTDISQGQSQTGSYYTTFHTGINFDAKTTFAWGLDDVLATQTYETTALVFNPHVDVYAYLNGYFRLNFGNYWAIEFSAYVIPFDVEALSFKW